MPKPLHLRADWVLPIASAPIRDGEVVVEGGSIAAVRPRRVDGQPSVGIRELGEAIVIPGLVNVHSHLEYTVMRGLLDGLPFFDWIRTLTSLKARLHYADWVASAVVGAAEAVAGGTTTLADCTDSGAALDGMQTVGIRGIVYQEVFGIGDESPVGGIVSELRTRVADLRRRADPELHRIGISPHAPYTVRPALMRALAAYAADDQLPVCVHAAESHAEVELVRRGTGPIAQALASRGIAWQPAGTSVVEYLGSYGLLTPRTLLVHGVQVSASDLSWIRRSGASWAHCPRSNARLGVGVAPLRWMRACGSPDGARVGIGTDSVVSAGTMDMFEEMRFALMMQRAANRNPRKPSAQDVLEIATAGGARALGWESRIGLLREGASADLAVLSVRDRRYSPLPDPVNAVVFSGTPADIIMTIVNGVPVWERGRAPGSGVRNAARRIRAVAAKLTDHPVRLGTDPPGGTLP